MRTRFLRSAALAAAATLVLAACGDDNDDQQAVPENGETEEDLGQPEQDMDDPNEDVEDGIYRGNGVVLPVPDGWSLDPMMIQQGTIMAGPEDGTESQLAGQAIELEFLEEQLGQEADLDTLLEQQRAGMEDEPTVDEEIELAGAERAHRLTYENVALPPQPGAEEEMPPVSATLLLAEDGQGLLAEFSFSAVADEYDEDVEALLLSEAGFDPDSEPVEPQMPEMDPDMAPAPGGEGGEISPEDLEELEDLLEDQDLEGGDLEGGEDQ